jgi:ATP-dependent Clp endopeptidase proteolytic subunit ClpP
MTATLHPDLVESEKTRLEAETRKLLAEAAESEASAGLVNLSLESATRDHAEAAAADYRNHIFHFAGPVNAASVAQCQRTLAAWSRLSPGAPVEIVFNSPGGSVIDGMALWDYLQHFKKKGHHLTTSCRGYAASMGGILLQAGDVRRLGSESYLMIHEISAGTGGKIGEIQDAVKFYERICERVVDIFVNRSGGKCSKATFIKNWKRQDWWLSSDEALKFGFIDEVA